MDKIEHLAKKIRINNEYIKEKARSMREIAIPVALTQLNHSICALDGGLLADRMHGIDIIVSRAVGVNFIYENSKIKTFTHHPMKCPASDVEARSALDDHEANTLKSIIRLKSEISCAIELLEKFQPDLLLLDGSILPLPTDCPSKDSSVYQNYLDLVKLYQEMFSKSQSIAGVVKDTRAKRLSEYCSDSVLCSFLLEVGERTKEIDYTEFKEFQSLSKKIKITYMKPSINDLPFRVEIFGDVEKISSIVYTLSAISSQFAYPAILIEADLRAALLPIEIESVKNSLSRLAGIAPLRRNFRPFR